MRQMKVFIKFILKRHHLINHFPFLVHAKEHMHPDFNFFGGVQNPYLNNDELESSYWRNQAKDTIFKKLDRFQNINKAKNVIFFLGDGMSISTLTASRTYLGQTVGKTGEEYQLSFEKFPVAGLAKVNNILLLQMPPRPYGSLLSQNLF